MTPLVPDTLSQWAFSLLAFNKFIQSVTITAGVLGCGFSLYAIVDVARCQRFLKEHHLNGLRLSVVQLHLVLHSTVFLVQILLTANALLAFTLPDIPMEMYLGRVTGPWTVLVIGLRKIALLVACCALLATSVYKVRWLWSVPTNE